MRRRHPKKICHPMDSSPNTTPIPATIPEAKNTIPTMPPPPLQPKPTKATPMYQRSKQRYHYCLLKLQQHTYEKHLLQETQSIKTSERQMEAYTQTMHPHGQQSSTPSMNKNSSLHGENTSYSTNALLMTSLESGHPILVLNRMKSSSMHSNNKCKNDKDYNGNSPPSLDHVLFWK